MRFSFVLFAALVACGPPDPSKPTSTCSSEASKPVDGKPLVRLGTGGNGPFNPIAEGATLKLDYGSQGGKHVWIDVQSYTDHETVLNFAITLSDKNGAIVAQGNGATKSCGAWVTSTNNRVIFDRVDYVIPTDGLTLHVTETDREGTLVSQDLKVFVTP